MRHEPYAPPFWEAQKPGVMTHWTKKHQEAARMAQESDKLQVEGELAIAKELRAKAMPQVARRLAQTAVERIEARLTHYN